jgi:hypothetical protein
MSIFLGAIKQKNVPAIERRVSEINEMIRFAKIHKLEVVDKSNTWQAEMKYEQLKYSNGILYITYETLDLYDYLKGKGRKYKKESYKVGRKDTSYGGYSENESIRITLTDIARMYRSRINEFKKYGY